jgi:hypothetical protein
MAVLPASAAIAQSADTAIVVGTIFDSDNAPIPGGHRATDERRYLDWPARYVRLHHVVGLVLADRPAPETPRQQRQQQTHMFNCSIDSSCSGAFAQGMELDCHAIARGLADLPSRGRAG